jgi:hypothetical protein
MARSTELPLVSLRHFEWGGAASPDWNPNLSAGLPGRSVPSETLINIYVALIPFYTDQPATSKG